MPSSLKCVVAQLNLTVGAIVENRQKIIQSLIKSRDELKADLIIFPELAICGYPPEDLLLREDFYHQIERAIEEISAKTQGIGVILGHPFKESGLLYNALSFFEEGQQKALYFKRKLPNYGVFDERRYFSAGDQVKVVDFRGFNIGLLICEDLWYEEPIAETVAAGAELVISMNASPFDYQKSKQRLKILKERAQANQVPIIYVHGVGGQDELVFDGGSLAMDQQGRVKVQGPYFKEELIEIEYEKGAGILSQKTSELILNEAAIIYQALVLSLRDYIHKNHFEGVLVGVSGGMDSALILAIAVDALGKDHVEAVSLPSRHTSQLSLELIEELITSLGIACRTISIEESFSGFLSILGNQFDYPLNSETYQNLQARCRGVILMGLSNQTGKIVINTSNKSELAMGYSTLYGDMVGGFSVLKDVLKTGVYRLAAYRNSISPVIPSGIIERPPTAELTFNQSDQDHLPPYEILDQVLSYYIEQDLSLAEILEKGFDKDLVRSIIRRVDKNEYKRRQAPIGPRISTRTLGRERRYPIVSGFDPSAL